jgi:hypothetical protein
MADNAPVTVDGPARDLSWAGARPKADVGDDITDPPKRAFTHTWIFGAMGGRITFYEPMITLAFLLGQPDVCTPIHQPQAWQTAGYYPTEYCIRYLPESAAYTVSLEGLIERPAG